MKKVKFYLTSGIVNIMNFDDVLFEELVKTIKKDWNNITMATDRGGMNFAHVTHYIVIEEK